MRGDPHSLPLEPLPYHLELIEYLRTQEADLWNWFAADPDFIGTGTDRNDSVRLDLLKSTYRLEREANPSLYQAADEVANRLGLSAPAPPAADAASDGAGPAVPITIYQSQSAGGLNVSLAYLPGEAHLVLTGPVGTTLGPVELRGVLAHELTHFALLDRWRDYLVASRLLSAMTHDEQANVSHVASARLFSLYSEVYCDRGALRATGDLHATITALVKIETGLSEVSADSYLRQAEEIFARGHPRSEGITHPETFIRAKALAMWSAQPDLAARQLGPIIEGPPRLAELDLPGRRRVSHLTRRLIQRLLRPRWLRTEATLAHARLFFDDFRADGAGPPIDAAVGTGEPPPGADGPLAEELKTDDETLRDYYCYVLLDFAVADRDLEETPLAAAMVLADELGLGERFSQLAAGELNLRKKQFEALRAQARDIVARAAEATG